MTDLRGPPVARRRPLLAGIALLATSFGLGAALRNNLAGTPLDSWFQRETVTESRHPGQPGFNDQLYVALTQATRAGASPGVIYLVVILSLAILWMGTRDRRPAPSKRTLALALAPALAVTIAAGSAELVMKPLIDRRMIGNESVLTYPSGHAVATASVVSATLIVMLGLRRPCINRAQQMLWGTAVFALIVIPLVVGLDMAMLRSHFLTDVVGGWAWGCGWGLLTGVSLARPVVPRRLHARRRSSMASA